MLSRYAGCFVALATLTVVAQAQTLQKRSVPLNMRNPGEGRCVVEVVVDGAAQVEIRGDVATLRNLKGQSPQWKRFECTSPLPANPADFRFRGIDGRGQQQLLQAPQNGGVATIRIDDPDNGQEGYTFEVTWGVGDQRGMGEMSRNGPVPVMPAPVPPMPQDRGMQGPPMQDRRDLNGRDNGDRRGNRFGTDEAIQGCQTYVRTQAARRYGANEIVFRRTLMVDQPGRNDFVTGFFEARNVRQGRPRSYRFSCSVNFDTGMVRSADIQPMRNNESMYGEAATSRAIQGCEVSVEQRLARDGYSRIDFGSVNIDDRPGRNDYVVGVASGLERGRPVWFDFSCSVNLQDGDVRSAEVNRR